MAPVYELTIPSSGKRMHFRPYVVSEEKVLAMAGEADDIKSIITAVKRIVSACADSPIDVDSLCLFDLEYLFINIRAKSVGEISRVKIACSDESCNTYNDVNLDLSKTKVVTNGTADSTVALSDEVTLTLQYITVGAYERFEVGKDYDGTSVETLMKLLACSIKTINGVPTTEYAVDELLHFVESFSRDSIQKIQSFIETTPVVQTVIEFKCKKCKKENAITVSGIGAFFKVAMAHMSLMNYYKENFAMMQHHGYSLAELENMIPWEREIYLALLSEHIVQENERIAKQNAEIKAKSRGR